MSFDGGPPDTKITYHIKPRDIVQLSERPVARPQPPRSSSVQEDELRNREHELRMREAARMEADIENFRRVRDRAEKASTRQESDQRLEREVIERLERHRAVTERQEKDRAVAERRVRDRAVAERLERDRDRAEAEQVLRAAQKAAIRRYQVEQEEERERDRTGRDSDRSRSFRKERRTNSGRNTLEPRQSRDERASSAVVAPRSSAEESKSIFSGWPFRSNPVVKDETALKSNAPTKIESLPKVVKSEPQPKSVQETLMDLDGYFIQPAQESEIERKFTALCQSIDDHVFNHYDSQTTSIPLDSFSKIIQADDEYMRPFQNLLNQEACRSVALRVLIARVITNNIALGGDLSTTFLPAEISSLLSMAPVQSSEAFRFAASSVLRRTAANLLRLGQSGESVTFTQFQRERVKMATNYLQKRLSGLALPSSSAPARRDQMEAIVASGAQIGSLLLLQPATYHIEWSSNPSTGSSIDDKGRAKTSSGPIVVFPGLEKLGDSSGRAFRRPQLVCRPEYMDEDDLQ